MNSKKENNNIKELYPEIAKLTIQDIVSSDAFKLEYDKLIGLGRRKMLTLIPHESQYINAFNQMMDSKNIRKASDFAKYYIDCLDRVSNLPVSKRVVIYSIGNFVYSNTIKGMMDKYDHEHKRLPFGMTGKKVAAMLACSPHCKDIISEDFNKELTMSENIKQFIEKIEKNNHYFELYNKIIAYSNVKILHL